MRKRLITGLAVVFGTLSLMAYNVPTGWMNDFAAATNLATQTRKPLVMYWGNIGCSHCDAMTLSVQQADFISWRQTRDDKYVFLYVRGQNHKDFAGNEGAKEFAATAGGKRSSLSAYPFVTFWWSRPDGKLQAQNVTGTTYKMNELATKWGVELANESLGLDLAQLADDYFEAALVEEKLAFEATGTLDDRYEIEPDTEWVKIPVLRTAGMAKASSGKIKVAYPGLSSKKTRSFTWAAGETRKYVTVYTSANKVDGYVHTPGENLTLYLYDANGTKQATTRVYMVDKQPNGPVNPYFVGETNELAFGEWTMDLDLATNTVAQTGGKGTLVFFTGALWCPHCRPLESNVLETVRFREWTRKNKIALVTMDNPKRAKDASGNNVDDYLNAATTGKATLSAVPCGDGPTLLRYDLGANGCSGAAYRSRKMIIDGAAELVLQRNHTLGYAGGFFNAPSSFRTGYPTIILLDAQGQIRGRFVRCEEAGCVYDLDENMRRFDEFIKLADTGTPENSYAATTELEHEIGTTDEVELALQQNTRYYDVVFPHAGEFTVEETENDSTNALVFTLTKLQDVTVDMLDADGASVSTFDYTIAPAVASAQGKLVCAVQTGGVYRLGVSSYVNASSVRRKPDDTSLVASFATSMRYLAAEEPLEIESDGTPIRFPVTVGLVYRIACEDDVSVEGPVEAEGDLYTATADGEVVVSAPLGALVTIQIWKTDPAFVETTCTETFWRYFANTRTYDLRNVGFGTVSFKRVSGTIPDGLTLACEGNKLVLAWSPTSSGTYTFALQIREKRDGKTVKGNVATFTIKTQNAQAKNPYVSGSTSSSSSSRVTLSTTVPLMGEAGDGGNALAGVLTVSVSSKNQISAKYQGTEPTALSYSGYWQNLASDYTADATLASSGTTLKFALAPNGELTAVLTMGAKSYSHFAEPGESLSGSVSVATPASFKPFKGYYTVQLPPLDEATSNQVLTGCGSLRLKMTSSTAYKAGTMTWAGVLPDGTTVSGSSQLGTVSEKVSSLPVFVRKDVTATDVVGRTDESVLGLVADVYAGASEAWKHPEVMEAQMLVLTASGTQPYLIRRDEVDTYLPLKVCGGAFATDTTPKAICNTFGYLTTCAFSIDTSRLAALDDVAVASVPSAKAKATNAGFTLSSIAGGTLSLDYTASKGQFSGRAQVTFADGATKSAKYYGVLMPGWLSCDECGEPSPDDRPFGAGTLFWDEDGIRRSAPVTIKATLKD